MPGGEDDPTTDENNIEKVEPSSSPSSPSIGGGGRMLGRQNLEVTSRLNRQDEEEATVLVETVQLKHQTRMR